MVEREAGKGKHESEKLMRTDGIDSAQLNARFPHPLSMALQHASSIKAIIHGVEKSSRSPLPIYAAVFFPVVHTFMASPFQP